MKQYIKLMRPKHYIKNLIIFLPLIFSTQLLNISKLKVCIIGFISFCFLASVVYIVNDIKDLEKDRNHPVKRNRPLASGKISKKHAIILIIVLIIVCVLCNIAILLLGNISIQQFIIVISIQIAYFIANIAYSLGLKNIPILDVAIVVSGFILRMFYGAVITNIEISNWLYLTIMSGSFYMAFGKRRNEAIDLSEKTRKVLAKYNKDFLDKFMYVCLVLVIVFYSLWCIDTSTIERVGNNNMILTIPLLLIILMKYSLDVENDTYGDPVDTIVKDKWIIVLSGIFAILIIMNIYVL